MVPKEILEELRAPHEFGAETVNFFRKNAFIKIKDVFSKELIDYYSEIISQKVSEHSSSLEDLDNRDTYGKAFLQVFNLWREDESIRELVLSRKLGKIAADLMEVGGVRLYHDQALFKEPGGGFTPWHADQYYWPLSTDRTVTAWIPLQATPLEMGPLEFSAGSQAIKSGRELAISDESEQILERKLKVPDFPHIVEAFDIGEVSFHSGWIFHRAGANKTSYMRQAMTVIYMDKDMRLAQPQNKNQVADWETWCPGAKVGEVINTPLNPVIWE